jgi:two-component system response regulator NreC
MTFFDCLYPLESPSVALSEDDLDRTRERREHRRDESLKSKSGEVRILVVEDHELTRKAICDLLRTEKGFEVVCDVANGLDGARAAATLEPDIVLLDVTMPTLGGIEAAVRIHRVTPKTKIIFVSQHNSDKLAQAALATGARGYVLKSAAGTDLISAVRAVLAGEKFVSKLKRWGDP